MFVVIGLGNPGEAYEESRHNLGFRLIDRLCERWGNLRLRETARHSVFVRLAREGRDIVLAKPTTYMNRSGFAAAELLELFAARPDEALVLFDDNALPTGTIRIRRRGGSGGHRGVESIIETLGSEEFPRVRLGIGPPQTNGVEHVLSSFAEEERAAAEESIGLAADAVEFVLTEGIDAAMNRYNRKLSKENGISKEEENMPGENPGDRKAGKPNGTP